MASGRTAILEVVTRSALWLCLAGWIGGFGLFALVVAPTAFQVLPSTQVAGTLVGPVLETLHLYGAAAGVVTALLAWRLHRGALLCLLPLTLTVACLYTQFGVSAEIAEIRHLTTGPEGNAEAAGRFNQLHRLSMGIFAVVWVGAIALLVLHAHADSRPSPDS
jgi:hypothetical protein